MAFKKLNDIEIDGVKITNVFMEAEYYPRTNGYNYLFCFHCDLEDEDAVYELCKKAFPEGKNHVKYDGSIGTYAVDHDSVIAIGPESKNEWMYAKGCNWAYWVNEGNNN